MRHMNWMVRVTRSNSKALFRGLGWAIGSQEFELLVHGLLDGSIKAIAFCGSKGVPINNVDLHGASMKKIQSHAAIVGDHVVGVIDDPIDVGWIDLGPAVPSGLTDFFADPFRQISRVWVGHDGIGAGV